MKLHAIHNIAPPVRRLIAAAEGRKAPTPQDWANLEAKVDQLADNMAMLDDDAIAAAVAQGLRPFLAEAALREKELTSATVNARTSRFDWTSALPGDDDAAPVFNSSKVGGFDWASALPDGEE